VVQPAGRRALEHLLRHDHQARRASIPRPLLKAFGDPKALLTNAKLEGSEDVGGVKSDHVTGDIDLAALVQGIAAVAQGLGQRHVREPDLACAGGVERAVAAAVR